MYLCLEMYRTQNIKRLLLFLAGFLPLLLATTVSGQIAKEFWFAPPKLSGTNPTYKLYLTTLRLPAHVTVKVGSTFICKDSLIKTGNTTLVINIPKAVIDSSVAGQYRGIYIKSCEYIEAGFEAGSTIGGNYCREAYSLKGTNALGTSFVVPAQKNAGWDNVAGYTASLHVISAQNGNNITIQPPSGAPVNITLNAGQTYTYNSSSSTDHLAGATVVSTNGRKLAVTYSDEAVTVVYSTSPSIISYDNLGDQLVPVSVFGKEYIVHRGRAAISPNQGNPISDGSFSGELAFIVSPQAGTVITVNGVARPATTVPNQVDTLRIRYNSMYVKADKPVGIFHVTGEGAELGGAIVPPMDYIANQCPGSTEVYLYIPPSLEGIVYLTLIVPKGAEDGFFVDYPDGSSYQIDPTTSFTAVPSTYNWMALVASRKVVSSLPGFNSSYYGKTIRIRNIYNLFHFGYYINHPSTAIKGVGYRYFSSFSPETSDGKYAYISHVIRNGKYIDVQSKVFNSCVGDTLLLSASAGKEYMWRYINGLTTYLDYPTQPNPRVFSLPENSTHRFYVKNTRSDCFGTRYDTVTINTSTAVWARFTGTVTQGCSPLQTTLLDSSMGANIVSRKYYLSYAIPGHAVRDSLLSAAPPQSFPVLLKNILSSNELIDTIKLVLTNNAGCQDSITRLVTVYPQLAGYIRYLPVKNACDSFEVAFADSVITKSSFMWKWDFGDGATNVSSHSPVHIFRNKGMNDTVYKTYFYTTSYYGCKDTDSVAFTIYPYVKAAFGVDTTQGCGPLPITIHNTAIGPVSSYTWQFGDGTPNSNTSASQFTHVYNNNTASSAVYTLKQVVKNSHQCADSFQRSIKVFPNITATFVKPVPLAYCSPQTISFTGPVNVAPVAYEWDFGDSIGSPLQNPQHTYRNLGPSTRTYRTRLKVISQDGCVAYDSVDISIHDEVEAIFTVDKSDGCADRNFKITNVSHKGQTFIYAWDFDDGSPLDNRTDSVFYYHYTNPALVPQTHTITLTVRNDKNCVSSLSRQVTVYPAVHASFDVSTLAGCTPLDVVFTNKTNPAVASLFRWDFGDGSSSFTYHAGKTYANTRDTGVTYHVQMVAVSDYACADTADTLIHVASFIKAAFAIHPSEGCSPLQVNFSDNSTGGVQKRFYSYGDGGSDTLYVTSFSRTFYNYSLADTVTHLFLRVYNEANCTDSATLPLTIYPRPQASFTASTRGGCQPLTVNYTNTSNPVAASYAWNFGDGHTSSQVHPSNTFVNISGSDTVFTIRLIASSLHGCKDTAELTDTVYAYVEAKFKLEHKAVCSGETINIIPEKFPGNSDYYWDYENDAITDDSYSKNLQPAVVSHLYPSNAGPDSMVYTISLRVRNTRNCYDTTLEQVTIYPYVIADFTYDSAGCSPHYANLVNTSSVNAVESRWLFSDSTSSFETNPSKIFLNTTESDKTHTATLIVTSAYGCKDTVIKTFTIYATPVVFFEPDTILHCSPFKVTFFNRSTADPVTTYYWDYADGTVDSTFDKSSTVHTYVTNRTDSATMRNVQVIAVTQHGCRDTGYSPIYIYPITIARFGVQKASCAPYIAHFSDSSVNARYYFWDFGDNQYSLSNAPQHLYPVDGRYLVTLVTASKNNCRDTIVDTITVYPSPRADFLIAPIYQRYPNASVTLYNRSTDAAGTPIYSSDTVWTFRIDWGDSTFTTTLIDSTLHTYATWNPTGEQYAVTLTISNPTCDTSLTRLITILPPFPVARFLRDTSGCPPLTVYFQNQSLFSSHGFVWNFGDGSPVEYSNEASHTYTEPGIYNVQLTAIGEDGVRDVAYRNVRVFNVPSPKFYVEPKEVQYPEAVINVVDSTRMGEFYHWHLTYLKPLGHDEYDTIPYEVIHSKTFSYTFRDTSKYGKFLIWLEVESDSLCPAVSDTQEVIVNPQPVIVFPNAFTPSLDGPSSGGKYNPRDNSNDIFFPYVPADRTFMIDSYRLEIYDRWGELLFVSDDLSVGWDGYYKGSLCKQDVYVYRCKGTYINGQKFEFKGDVTLLHKSW